MSGFYCKRTEHGVAVELHENHIAPLLEIARAAKAENLDSGNHALADLFREIEWRLDGAMRRLEREP